MSIAFEVLKLERGQNEDPLQVLPSSKEPNLGRVKGESSVQEEVETEYQALIQTLTTLNLLNIALIKEVTIL